MCDQNQVQIITCDPNSSIQFECLPNGCYESIKSCSPQQTEATFCPPECLQCCPPTTSDSNCQSFEYGEPQCSQPQCIQTECQPCVTTCDPCDPCVPRCSPCEPLGPCPLPCPSPCDDTQPKYPCPTLDTCNPMCSPYQRCRYVQPPRRESYRPNHKYQRPVIPMTSDTIYKRSFEGVDPETAACCRMPAFRPGGQLQMACGSFAKETVTKLSFQPHCCPSRTQPIYPVSRISTGQGQVQSLTTQKHDFVPKFQHQRPKMVPRDNIQRACGCIENKTIQKMSYAAPQMSAFSKAESCKPIICYKAPELPMEFETTQKLSYMPVCPAPKDDMPWAKRAQYCPPTIKFARDTINKLSYQPPGCFLGPKEFCCEVKNDCTPRASC